MSLSPCVHAHVCPKRPQIRAITRVYVVVELIENNDAVHSTQGQTSRTNIRACSVNGHKATRLINRPVGRGCVGCVLTPQISKISKM